MILDSLQIHNFGSIADLSLQLGFNPWPRDFHMPQVWPLKQKKDYTLEKFSSLYGQTNNIVFLNIRAHSSYLVFYMTKQVVVEVGDILV